MYEILKEVIKWYEENKLTPEMYFYSQQGGIWLMLKLHSHGKCIAHEFYIPGGVLCVSNFESRLMEEEVKMFIEEAKVKLLGDDQNV